MVTLDHIEFRYPKRKQFSLSEISFSIRSGEIFTLLGPNGAGKTTLIRILSGLILPQKGNLSICGMDMLGQGYKARRQIGLVLGDERTFYYRLTGAQNLEFFGGLHGLSRRALKSRVPEVLEMVGLTKDARLQFMRYSTGMRKRLNMARALLHNPQVLLLDEPNSGVDPESARRIRHIILDLKKQGRAILLATHVMDEAERVSNRIGFLKNGRLIRTGTADDFKKLLRTRTFEVEFALDSVSTHRDVQSLITEIRQVTVVDRISFRGNLLTINANGSFDINSVLAVIYRKGLQVTSTNTRGPTLEDAFIALAK